MGVIGFFILSILLGEMSFEEHNRILFDLGVSAIHWLNLGVCIFIGGGSLRRELDRQTYMTLLSTPLSRPELLVGKFIGIFSVALFSTILLGGGLFMLLKTWGALSNFIIIIIGILVESSILLMLSLLLSLVVSPFVGIFASLGIYLMGHWLESLKYFASKANSVFYFGFSEFMDWTLPNLYRLNWRSPYVLEAGLGFDIFGASIFHGIGWVVILAVIATVIFNRKNLI
jgi:ABC-type transport system involved in multi-copper enzyme maturation permease subunit